MFGLARPRRGPTRVRLCPSMTAGGPSSTSRSLRRSGRRTPRAWPCQRAKRLALRSYGRQLTRADQGIGLGDAHRQVCGDVIEGEETGLDGRLGSRLFLGHGGKDALGTRADTSICLCLLASNPREGAARAYASLYVRWRDVLDSAKATRIDNWIRLISIVGPRRSRINANMNLGTPIVCWPR